MRRAARLLALAAVTLAVGIVSPSAAGAGAGDGGGEPSITLVSQADAWIDVGGELLMELDVDGAGDIAGAHVTLTAYEPVNSRITFEENLEGESLGSVQGQIISVPLDLLETTPTGTRLLQVGLQSETNRDDNRLPLRSTGVYPVAIELRDADDQVLDGFVNPVVAIAPGPNDTPVVGERLRVAWVWPIVASPATLPDGESDPAVVEAFRPSGRLGRQLAALADAEDVPVTLAPSPETMVAWDALGRTDQALAGGPDALRDVADTSQILSGPYVPIDVPSLLGAGLSGAVGDELLRGSNALGTVLETRLDPRTALPGPLDDAALVRLADTGVDQMIVPDTALTSRESELTPAEPTELQAQGRTVRAAVADSGLSELLVSPDVTAGLRAQRFLAALAVVALEQPAIRRGVVVLNPADFEAAAPFYESVLDGLTDHPLLQPVTVDTFLADVPDAVDAETDTPVVRQLVPAVAFPPPVPASDWLSTDARLEAFASLVSADDLRVIGGNQALLVSLSALLGDDTAGREQAAGYLNRVNTAIDDFLGLIRVPDAGRTITLTARTGELPITFLNETDETIRVRVTLRSTELRFPDGTEREIELPPRSTTIEFPIEARASGTFPVDLTVTTVSGGMEIQSTEIQVRSTFVSGVGIFLTVGAGVFLALWWGNDIRRRRKRKANPLPSPA